MGERMTDLLLKDEQTDALCRQVATLHTLGPEGTNCQRAAETWFSRQRRQGAVKLHPTLEVAVEALYGEPGAALLACVVYPELHTLVFTNLHRLTMIDCFVVPTHNMVLATRRDNQRIQTVATHPAPSCLVPASIPQRILVNSNTQAALDCVAGLADACITTLPAVERHDLRIIRDFGPVPMGFTIHAQLPGDFAGPEGGLR